MLGRSIHERKEVQYSAGMVHCQSPLIQDYVKSSVVDGASAGAGLCEVFDRKLYLGN